MIHHTERPCAAHGWTSYRYAGRYGHIMIGAPNTTGRKTYEQS